MNWAKQINFSPFCSKNPHPPSEISPVPVLIHPSLPLNHPPALSPRLSISVTISVTNPCLWLDLSISPSFPTDKTVFPGTFLAVWLVRRGGETIWHTGGEKVRLNQGGKPAGGMRGRDELAWERWTWEEEEISITIEKREEWIKLDII